jgi:hypothetical protein
VKSEMKFFVTSINLPYGDNCTVTSFGSINSSEREKRELVIVLLRIRTTEPHARLLFPTRDLLASFELRVLEAEVESEE